MTLRAHVLELGFRLVTKLGAYEMFSRPNGSDKQLYVQLFLPPSEQTHLCWTWTYKLANLTVTHFSTVEELELACIYLSLCREGA